MNFRRAPLVAAALAAVLAVSCGMRGGSNATIISGIPSSESGSGSGGAGSTGPVPSGGGGGAALTASAPGITPDTITIGTIQDISGPVPGLFQTALDGIKAWVAYQNAHGGIDGRHIVLDTYDSGLNPTTFSQEVTKACAKDFALVGVMSAADNAGALPGQQCGIPDLADNPTTPQAAAGTNVFAVVPSLPNEYPDGSFRWIKEHFPKAAANAAIMWPNEATTEVTGERLRDTEESVGFTFTFQNATPLLEADFLPYVQTMKDKGVQYFAWQADYQSMARILAAMQQLNWYPQFVDASATTYNQQFLTTAGAAANGMYVTLNVGLFNEASENPEMSHYLAALNRYVPGHQPPDIFGVYSWAAGDLLDQVLTQAGPNPTRSSVISALGTVHAFTGNGIMASMDVGAHQVGPCFEIVQVKSGAFVRVYPTKPDTYDCSSGHLYNDPKIPAASVNG